MIIKSQRLKEAILAALADKEMVKILDCVMYNPKPVNDIIKENNIPHTTTYRKIKWLAEERLLVIDKMEITEEGRKISLFRSTLKSINIKYEHNILIIEAEQNINIMGKTAERFFSLD
jgi:hypothetical protein